MSAKPSRALPGLDSGLVLLSLARLVAGVCAPRLRRTDQPGPARPVKHPSVTPRGSCFLTTTAPPANLLHP